MDSRLPSNLLLIPHDANNMQPTTSHGVEISLGATGMFA